MINTWLMKVNYGGGVISKFVSLYQVLSINLQSNGNSKR